jgi:predicted permease
MPIVTSVRLRLRALIRREHLEREMSKEMQFHLDRETELNVRRGLPLDEARRAARVAFGGVEQMKDASRDARGTARIESIWRDVRYAIRSLMNRPAFTVTVVATLALGIGANAAIFTLVDALLLRPLPVAHPEQLVIVGTPSDLGADNVGLPITDLVSMPLYKDVRERNTVFSDMYASGWSGPIDVQMGAHTDPGSATGEQPNARFVTGNFFSVLGVPAYAGRTFTAAEDETPGEDPVAVITYDYWQRRFAGSSDAIGSVMRVNDVQVTIIGVTPPGFAGDIVGQPIDFWLPMMMVPVIRGRNRIVDRGWSWLSMMARLKPGVSLEHARREISAIEANAVRENLSGLELSQFNDNLKEGPIQVVSGARGFSERRAEYGKALWVLMAAVALVILVVCANVSSLMLARIVARGREMTVRMTLGASRGRLIQQMLVEGALLALVSSALGLLAATSGTRLLLTTVSGSNPSNPIAVDTRLDARALAFTGVLTLGCVLLFGLLPAFRATRVDLAKSLRSQGRSLMGGTRVGRIPFGRVLVVAQIALSMLLLIGGGLLVHSMQQLLHSDIGVDRDHLIAVRVRTPRSQYVGARLGQLRQDLADHVRQLPGVDAAAFADHGLFSGGASGYHVTVPGFVAQADSERRVSLDRVGPDFVHAIGGHLLRGRDIERRDLETGPATTIINETMAKRYFAGRDPVAVTVTLDSVPYTIVGVVRDFQSRNVRGKPRREMYIVFNDPNSGGTDQAKLSVHVRGDPSHFVAAVRRVVEATAPALPVHVDPVNDLVRGTVSQDLLLVQVTMFFCIVTLVLAALGLYGVTAYSTSQRTSEFGLRAALGAEPGRVTRMVLGEGVRVSLLGVIIGVPAGLAATRLIRAQLFGVGSIDLLSLTIAIAVLMATAVVASYVPARRAAKAGPLEALRLE